MSANAVVASPEEMLPIRSPRLAVRLRGVAVAGAFVIFGFMGGFAVWASTAPLAAGAVVRGVVGPEASRKSIQHLEGGIVREILVKDGDLVKRGQPLITLERTQAQATVGQIRDTLSRREAEAARLLAQVNGAAKVDFSAAIADSAGDPSFADFVKNQQELFETSVKSLAEKQSLLQTQVTKLRTQVESNNARIAGSKDQRRLIDIQIADIQALMDKGLARKPQLLDLQRRRSELDTDIASLTVDSKRSDLEAVEKQITLQNAKTSFLNDAASDLSKARADIAGLQAKLAASVDVLIRTQVLAPDDGYVMNLQVKTIGGVIRPGTEILQIVPTKGDLIIEGRVSPNEIRNIEIGQPARVSFTSFPMRDMPMIPGKVLTVSADAITDPNTRESYFTARISVDRAAFAAYANPIDLKPGTPVEAYVEARKRVAAEYFLEPIIHSFHRSFREQ